MPCTYTFTGTAKEMGKVRRLLASPSTGPTEPLRKKKKIEVEKLPVLTDPSLSDEVWLKPVHDTKGQENTCCRKLSE